MLWLRYSNLAINQCNCSRYILGTSHNSHKISNSNWDNSLCAASKKKMLLNNDRYALNSNSCNPATLDEARANRWDWASGRSRSNRAGSRMRCLAEPKPPTPSTPRWPHSLAPTRFSRMSRTLLCPPRRHTEPPRPALYSTASGQYDRLPEIAVPAG